jgi:hypothetical protein
MGSEEVVAGQWIVRASVWLALVCYPAGPLGIAISTNRGRRAMRLVWTLGGAVFLVHVITSFHFFYDWSHAVAVAETARQVAELTGRGFGAGIYLNYVFTAIWVFDAAWWWFDAAGYQRRSWIGVLLAHGFFLFMIFNATVVFEDGATRAMGLAVTAVGVIALAKAVRRLKAER